MDRSLRYWFGITGVVKIFLMACMSVAQVAATANEEYRRAVLRAKAASEMDPPFQSQAGSGLRLSNLRKWLGPMLCGARSTGCRVSDTHPLNGQQQTDRAESNIPSRRRQRRCFTAMTPNRVNE